MKLTSLAAGLALAALPITGAAILAQDAPQAPAAPQSPAAPETPQNGEEMPQPITDPQQFADSASSSNMFEIQSSQIALDVSDNPDVLAFAEQMVADHTAAGDQMTQAAEADGITPAAGLEELHQAQLDELVDLDGEAFDEAYIAAQVAAHRAAVALFQSFSTDGEDGALKSFAAETLPTLEQHLEHILHLSGE